MARDRSEALLLHAIKAPYQWLPASPAATVMGRIVLRRAQEVGLHQDTYKVAARNVRRCVTKAIPKSVCARHDLQASTVETASPTRITPKHVLVTTSLRGRRGSFHLRPTSYIQATLHRPIDRLSFPSTCFRKPT